MRFFVRSFVLILAFTLTSVAQKSRLSELLSAEYLAKSDVSKLTLAFNNAPVYSQEMLSPTQIRLTFPNARSARYANRVPLIFRSGNAKSVAFDFSRRDTLVLIVTLNGNVQFDVHATAEKRNVVLELYPSSGPVVDIKAMVKDQALQARGKYQGEINAGTTNFSPTVFALSFILSLVSTAIMMYVRFFKKHAKKLVISKPALQEMTSHSGVDAILAQAKLILEEKTRLNQLDISPKVSVDERDDATLSLARKFQRGHGELMLAKNLEKKNREFSWESKLGRLDAKTTGRSVATTAKKLGVGSGELNLALSLRRVQQQQVRKDR